VTRLVCLGLARNYPGNHYLSYSYCNPGEECWASVCGAASTLSDSNSKSIFLLALRQVFGSVVGDVDQRLQVRSQGARHC